MALSPVNVERPGAAAPLRTDTLADSVLFPQPLSPDPAHLGGLA